MIDRIYIRENLLRSLEASQVHPNPGYVNVYPFQNGGMNITRITSGHPGLTFSCDLKFFPRELALIFYDDQLLSPEADINLLSSVVRALEIAGYNSQAKMAYVYFCTSDDRLRFWVDEMGYTDSRSFLSRSLPRRYPEDLYENLRELLEK